MIEPAIAVEAFSKTYPPALGAKAVVAVRDLTLRIAAGEIYGLLGPNGSGKSTTLKGIMGLVSLTRGSIRIFGRDSRTVASRGLVGFLPENPYFHKFLSGRETLHFYGQLCGVPRSLLRARAAELLERVGLSAAKDRRLSTYSKGMLQRIGLAQALISEPRVVILDEPTAGVDPAGTVAIRDLLLELKKTGVTVLLSSHLLAQVQEICDRVGILGSGRLVREGTLDDLLARPDQSQLVLENASKELLQELRTIAQRGGARVIEDSRPRTTLESVFLEVTGHSPE